MFQTLFELFKNDICVMLLVFLRFLSFNYFFHLSLSWRSYVQLLSKNHTVKKLCLLNNVYNFWTLDLVSDKQS